VRKKDCFWLFCCGFGAEVVGIAKNRLPLQPKIEEIEQYI
jgi:hypothetical protein